jgi:hypothetical protein
VQVLGGLLAAAGVGERQSVQRAEPRVVVGERQRVLHLRDSLRGAAGQQVRHRQVGADAGVVVGEGTGGLELGHRLRQQPLARQVRAVRGPRERERGRGDRRHAQRRLSRRVVERGEGAPRGGEHERIGRLQCEAPAEVLVGVGVGAGALGGDPQPAEVERVVAVVVPGVEHQLVGFVPPLVLAHLRHPGDECVHDPVAAVVLHVRHWSPVSWPSESAVKMKKRDSGACPLRGHRALFA